MRIVHLNQTDIYGGAALAAWRLHRQLIADGHDSRLLVGTVGDPDLHTSSFTARSSVVGRLAARLLQRYSLHHLDRCETLALSRHPWVRGAEVIVLNNIRQVFSYAMVPWLAMHKPVIWVLHDMWPFTGHCAYATDCAKWALGCGACPHLDAYPAMEWDFSRTEWRIKRVLFNLRRLTLVTPSRWMASHLPKSLLSRHAAHTIPYGIDLGQFTPDLRASARSQHGLGGDTVALLVASDKIDNPRKGIRLWMEALESLPEPLRQRCVILAMGQSDGPVDSLGSIRTKFVGVLTSEAEKARFYAAGDLLLFPTRADNLPLVPIESVACGTPVLAPTVGGVPEIVVPGRSGWLVDSVDPSPMLASLKSLLERPAALAALRPSSRELAVERFDLRSMAAAHDALYRSLVSPRQGGISS